MEAVLRMKKLFLVLLFILLLCQVAHAAEPLSRECWRYGYDSPNGWLYVTIWPDRPWLDIYEFLEDDGMRWVHRLHRIMVSEGVILDVAIVTRMVLVVTATEEWAAPQLFSPYTEPLRFERIEKPAFMKNIRL